MLAGSLYISGPALPEENSIPEIPKGDCLMSVKPVPMGFLHEYDSDGDGRGDYRTLRMIKNITPFGISLTKPLFYYIDLNRNFIYDEDETYVDDDMDGINGNERLYEREKPNPSSRKPTGKGVI